MDEGQERPPLRGRLLALLIAVVLAAATLVYLFYQQPSPVSLNEELLQTNHEFGTANTYMKQRDYASAKAAYERALALAENPQQEGLIRFNIARATEYAFQFESAIDMLKDIAADERYTPRHRAYAVQEIGLMRTVYPWEHAIPEATFRGEPYASFAEGVDENEAYAQLFRYAVSFSPLSLSYVHEAYWETEQLASLGSTTTPEAEERLGRILDALAASVEDKDRLLSNMQERLTYGPRIPHMEARLTERLADLEVDGFTHTRADELHASAVQLASVGFMPGNLFVYHYALFLARAYGDERQDDIRKLVAIFTPQNQDQIIPPVPEVIRLAQIEPALLPDKEALQAIARIAPTFDAYLRSLGWDESDFAN